jgi:hypothetical protein
MRFLFETCSLHGFGPRFGSPGPRSGSRTTDFWARSRVDYVFGPKPRSPDLLVPMSTPAPDLAPRPYTTTQIQTRLGPGGPDSGHLGPDLLGGSPNFWGGPLPRPKVSKI